MRKMIATIAITASAIIIPATIATAAPASAPASAHQMAVASPAGRWIQHAMAKTGTPDHWFWGLYTIAKRESSMNPNAVNNWDSNASAGTASKGLMQVIQPTFNAHHEPGTSYDILEPVANVSAAINYIKARYGDISNVQQANPHMPPKGY